MPRRYSYTSSFPGRTERRAQSASTQQRLSYVRVREPRFRILCRISILCLEYALIFAFPLGLLTILQPIWAAAGRVIISEIVFLRSLYVQMGHPLFVERDAELVGALDEIQNMLSSFVSMSKSQRRPPCSSNDCALTYPTGVGSHWQQIEHERCVLSRCPPPLCTSR
jgi:hypothetical protein